MTNAASPYHVLEPSMIRARRTSSLWVHTDFLKLWAGQTISLFGTQITTVALPLTAVISLRATPAQMGILAAVQYLPWILFSLFVGVWADRIRRRPLLICADIGRALLLALIPFAALHHDLGMGTLILIGFLVGSLAVIFDIAYPAFLPSLLGREHLVDANSKLEASSALAQIGGPSLGGVLVQVLTAPIAIAWDALSFLVSAFSLYLIRKPETPPSRATGRRGVWSEVVEGLRVLLTHPLLRPIVACGATGALFESAVSALLVLYVTRELHLTPAMLGLVLAASGPGSLLGSAVSGHVARRYGLGPTIMWSSLLVGVAELLIPLAAGPQIVIILLLITAQVCAGFFGPIYRINQRSLRQTITPNRLQGRVNAAFRMIAFGAIPVGALTGGIAGGLLGLRTTIALASLGTLLGFLWIYFSPVRVMRDQPAQVE